jgi:xanthine dehydrogenase molybdopterin-binding subunit B
LDSATGIGAPVRRVEDGRFLVGQGHYADDVKLSNMAYAHVVRSPHAHAQIGAIDRTAALSAPGVLAVLTAEDLARANIGGLACHAFPLLPEGSQYYRPLQPILATGKVRHVGDASRRSLPKHGTRQKTAANSSSWTTTVAAVTLDDGLAAGARKSGKTLQQRRLPAEARRSLCRRSVFAAPPT